MCQYCPKRFIAVGNRNDHQRRHLNCKPYQCPLCDAKYYRKYLLVKHNNSKHASSTRRNAKTSKKISTRTNPPV
jgi:hypothetical protein